MKVDIILFITCGITLTIVKAGSYFDIFPKSIMKYVITSRPYAQIRIYTPRPTFMPLNPFSSLTYQPVYRHTTSQVSEESSVTKHPLFHITEVPQEEQIPKQIIYNDTNDNNVLYPPVESNTRTSTVRNGKDLNIEDSAEYSTDISEIDEIDFQNDNDVFDRSYLNKKSPDLDKVSERRLPNKNLFNHWNNNIKDNEVSDALSEQNDENEFIFVKENERKYSSDLLLKNSMSVILDDNESMKVIRNDNEELRSKRSDNVIEEENIATTIPGLKYTGRNPWISERLIYKNIHL